MHGRNANSCMHWSMYDRGLWVYESLFDNNRWDRDSENRDKTRERVKLRCEYPELF